MPDTPTPNVLNPKCPSRKVFKMLANRWALLVLASLSNGEKRHGELMRELGDISQKMLTKTLRDLERNGLVTREHYPEIPPKVVYALSPLGTTLIEPIRALGEWTMAHFSDVEAARRAFPNK